MRIHYFLGILLGLFLALPQSLRGSLIVSANATGINGSPNPSEGGMFNSNIAHAVIVIEPAPTSTVSESSGPTGLPYCFAGPGLVLNGETQSRACAEANGGNGQLKSYARASNGASAFTFAAIQDPVFFLVPPTFTIDLDFDSFEIGGVWTAVFSLERATGISDQPWQTLYRYAITSAGFADGVTPNLKTELIRLDSTNPLAQPTYSEIIDENFSDVFTPLSFALGPLDQAVTMRVSLLTEAFCDEESANCDVSINALNTAYLGITTPYTSQNGYQYLGAAAAEVPEPASLALVGAGLLLLSAFTERKNFRISNKNKTLSTSSRHANP